MGCLVSHILAPEFDNFLDMVQKEANAADSMSSWLNGLQIVLLVAGLLAAFAATVVVAAELGDKSKRAILAGIPGVCAGLLAVVNPRVDWHRRKEIELNSIVSAVRCENLSVASASRMYWATRRGMEIDWEKAKVADVASTTTPSDGPRGPTGVVPVDAGPGEQ